MAPAFQDMELPDIPEALIDPALLMLGRVPFRFRDLPPEIQFQIFQLFRPAEPPRPTTDASELTLESWAAEDVTSQPSRPSRRGLYRCEPPWSRQACNFLFLNKSTYKDFAPYYYQSSVIRVFDSVTFADDFLANATNICLYNLRFVSCVMNARDRLRTSIERIEGVRKLADVVGDLHQLKQLQRFELVYIFQEFNIAWYAIGSADSRDEIWEMMDSEHIKGQLSRSEEHLSATIFKGFRQVRGVKPDEFDPAKTFGTVEHISITFTNDPQVPSRVFIYDEANGGTMNEETVWSTAAEGGSEVSSEDSKDSEYSMDSAESDRD